MPLPWVAGPVNAWRLDLQRHGPRWDSGTGAAKAGGRRNPVNYAVVYCSADPATAILEVAVHKGFHVLDTVPHVLTTAGNLLGPASSGRKPSALRTPASERLKESDRVEGRIALSSRVNPDRSDAGGSRDSTHR